MKTPTANNKIKVSERIPFLNIKKLEIMKKLFKIGYNKSTNCGWVEITENEWEDIKIQYVKDYGCFLTMCIYDKGELIGYGIY